MKQSMMQRKALLLAVALFSGGCAVSPLENSSESDRRTIWIEDEPELEVFLRRPIPTSAVGIDGGADTTVVRKSAVAF
jgi:hypothetical protein